jgi:hypothetical protein
VVLKLHGLFSNDMTYFETVFFCFDTICFETQRVVSILDTHFFHSTPIISAPVCTINNSPLPLLYTTANHYSNISATTGVAAMTDNHANALDNVVMVSVFLLTALRQLLERCR